MSGHLCSDFTYSDNFEVTGDVMKAFEENGYIIIRSLLSEKEITILRSALENDEGIKQHAYELSATDDGRKTRMCLWNHPGNDITGMIARSEKVAGTMEKLLGGEVYHFTTKLMMKDARTGGKHIWHQDYGYWYHNGCIFPDMGSFFLAVDKCSRENGCLQVLRSSHKLGRIEHLSVGGQIGADLERVNHIMKILELEHVEMEPGDGLFFHCNVLHRSDRNDSDKRRWVLITSFNRASNDPYDPEPFPKYTRLDKVPNSSIENCTDVTDMAGKDFLDPATDKNVKVDTK
ncbi:L-proline trans-4-hydroxylase-like [Amphiura filiformis]|uniref:L-proline trans-4-hydroxylase-like n=1 Tax=Amphiura filiformis TaxID=82378 RepID=UPI003B20C265